MGFNCLLSRNNTTSTHTKHTHATYTHITCNTHTHTGTHTHTHARTHAHTHMHTHTHTRIHKHTLTYNHIHMHTQKSTYTHILTQHTHPEGCQACYTLIWLKHKHRVNGMSGSLRMPAMAPVMKPTDRGVGRRQGSQ